MSGENAGAEAVPGTALGTLIKDLETLNAGLDPFARVNGAMRCAAKVLRSYHDRIHAQDSARSAGTDKVEAPETRRDDREGHFIHCLIELYDAFNSGDTKAVERAAMLAGMQEQADERSGAGIVRALRERSKEGYESFWRRANGRS